MENTLPKISVITPSYNQGQFLEETILSIINQNYPKLEYIIIDGASTDESIDIIKKYNDRITYWVSEKDNGQSEAINKGFKKATGDIVCWINSDDILLKDSLLKVGNYFQSHADIDFINGHTMRIDKHSNIIFTHFIPIQKPWLAEYGVTYCSQQSMFWKRSIFDDIGYLDESFHATMDLEFLLRIFKHKYNIGRIDDILGAIRIHENTKTSQNGKIWSNDYESLSMLYKEQYSILPNKFIQIYYRLFKMLNGLYVKQILFRIQWGGKQVKAYEANHF